MIDFLSATLDLKNSCPDLDDKDAPMRKPLVQIAFVAFVILTIVGIAYHHQLISSQPAANQKEIKYTEAGEAEFKATAELDGKPVSKIRLAEYRTIDGRFLVTIKNKYSTVEQLTLDYVSITDDDLKHLVPLTKLRSLSLFGVNKDGHLISNRGLEQIKSLNKIEELSFGLSAITDDGLLHLQDWTELRELAISSSPITDKGLAIIKDFPKLERLFLVRTGVTEKGFAHLSKMKNLRFLRVDEAFSDRSLSDLQDLSTIEELLLWSSAVTDDGTRFLKKMKKLRRLDFSGSEKVTGREFTNLPTSIELLGLSFLPCSDDNLACLQHLTSLKELKLGSTKITDRGLAHLVKLDQLTSLNLDNCEGITDDGMSHIAKLKSLQKLCLRYTNISDSGVAHLCKASQLTELEHHNLKNRLSDQTIEKLKKALPKLKIMR